MGVFGLSWLALAQAKQAAAQQGLQGGSYEEALKNYGAALEKQSDSPEALRGSIECYYALNRPSEARNKIRDARRAMPSNTYFQELEIKHEMTYGSPDNAIAPREEQAKRNPDKPDVILSLGQAYLATARSYIGKPEKEAQVDGLFTKARETFRQGITKWPDEFAFYAYFAETAARSGNLGDTEKLLKDLAARDKWKDRTEPLMLQAEYYGITKRYAEAEQMLRAIIAQDPKNTELQVRLANLLVNQNKPTTRSRRWKPTVTTPRSRDAASRSCSTPSGSTRPRRAWRTSSNARPATWTCSNSRPACSCRAGSSTRPRPSWTARWRSTRPTRRRTTSSGCG
jgi:predicted Zn-dependent protease